MAKTSREEPDLALRYCDPEAKKLPSLPPARRRSLHGQIPLWRLSQKSLSRTWRLEDFQQALDLANLIGAIAEREQHHPDLHLESYRNLRVVLSTHAAGGLTLNDFILAAHIDRLPDAAGGEPSGHRRSSRRPARRAGARQAKPRPRMAARP